MSQVRMHRDYTIRPGQILATLSGLVVVFLIISQQNLAAIDTAFQAAGLKLFILPILWIPSITASTSSWACFIPKTQRPPWKTLMYARWVGFAVNQLLPVARVGGELVRAHIASFSISELERRANIRASVVADKTIQIASIAIFGCLGLLLLSQEHLSANILYLGFSGIVCFAVIASLLFLAQRYNLISWTGSRITYLLPTHLHQKVVSSTNALNQSLGTIYTFKTVLISLLGHMYFRLALAIEIAILSSWFGHSIPLSYAVIMEATNQLFRSAAFMIPGALGAQEAGFIALGRVLGIPTHICLALSLGKRARELIVGAPALALWYLYPKPNGNRAHLTI